VTTSSSVAAEVWQAMRSIVLDNERRREACEALDLSFTRVKALLLVAADAISQRDLIVALGTDAAYVSLVVDELERRDLMQRHPDPDDRRRKLLRITTSGQMAADRARSILATPPQSIATLAEEDLASLLAILGPMADTHADPIVAGAARR
jgi:DNA-binding MarR family transcriptional regulator